MEYRANPVIVNAYRIKTITKINRVITLHFENNEFPSFKPTSEMLARIKPEIGDYLVQQEDGYLYLNPKSVFERKYSKND